MASSRLAGNFRKASIFLSFEFSFCKYGVDVDEATISFLSLVDVTGVVRFPRGGTLLAIRLPKGEAKVAESPEGFLQVEELLRTWLRGHRRLQIEVCDECDLGLPPCFGTLAILGWWKVTTFEGRKIAFKF